MIPNTESSRRLTMLLSMFLVAVGYAVVTLGLRVSRTTSQQVISTPTATASGSLPVATPTLSGQPGIATPPQSLIGGRVWRGPVGPLDTGKPTLTVPERNDMRALSRSLAVCTNEEALDFVASQVESRDWEYSIARRTTEDQVMRWLKGLDPTDPAQETSSVLWVVGIYSVQPLMNTQFLGWAFPSIDPAGAEMSTGHHDAVFVFTEDKSPVLAERPAMLISPTTIPGAGHSKEEYVAAIQRIDLLPTVPAQIEQFPNLEGLCSLPSE